ncbi:MAG: thermonuclease family protein [Actinomycetota bacterium]
MRALAVVILVLTACGPAVSLAHQAPATFPSEPGGFETGTVVRAIDGDTVEVMITARADGPGAGSAAVGATYDVRLIGIDSPESVRPGTPVECFGREAAAAATALLEGERVRLVKDVENEDGYGRLLRYVYLRDEMANARLVLNGYASAYTYPPNVRHAELFVSLQKEARESDVGLWGAEACAHAP